MKICVHTSGGPSVEPHVFYVGGHRLRVAGLVGRWSDPTHHHFEVRVEDGRRFLLRQDIAARDWELVGVYAATVRVPKSQLASGAATPAVQPRRWWMAARRP
jgi:hypothetical protein